MRMPRKLKLYPCKNTTPHWPPNQAKSVRKKRSKRKKELKLSQSDENYNRLPAAFRQPPFQRHSADLPPAGRLPDPKKTWENAGFRPPTPKKPRKMQVASPRPPKKPVKMQVPGPRAPQMAPMWSDLGPPTSGQVSWG